MMAYSVSNVFVSFARFAREWLLCPESIALFVVTLFLFNCLRLLRGLFVCFCQWKYKDPNNADSSSKDGSASQNYGDPDKERAKNYCHESKTHDMAVFSIQGRRKTMEDRFNFIEHDCDRNQSVYGVFDGHGGEFAAEYIEDQLFRSIKKEIARGSFQNDTTSIKQVLTSTIRMVDAQLVVLSCDRMDLSGSTGILAFQKDDIMTVANVGDSRAVMCDSRGKVVPLSQDHKPCDPKEQQRIVEAGGFVTFNGVWRVAGVLATSRAFGDYPLKQRKFVTVEPDFHSCYISEAKPHFVILATDGLWDVFSNEEAVDFVSERLDEPHFGAKSIALQAYYRGSLDNITVMVINFKKKRAMQKRFDEDKEEETILLGPGKQEDGDITKENTDKIESTNGVDTAEKSKNVKSELTKGISGDVTKTEVNEKCVGKKDDDEKHDGREEKPPSASPLELEAVRIGANQDGDKDEMSDGKKCEEEKVAVDVCEKADESKKDL